MDYNETETNKYSCFNDFNRGVLAGLCLAALIVIIVLLYIL
jgi:hypothetical protein